MATFDWHAERTDLSDVAMLDLAPESKGIDLKEVRLYRQKRVREQMAKYGVHVVILCDPVNIRYATGTRNMQIHTSRNAASRYMLLTAQRCILFDYPRCEHLSRGYETIDEVRTAKNASFISAGPHIEERERKWAAEMADLVRTLTGKPDATLGLERLNANVAIALRDSGLKIVDAQRPVELARAIKSPEELKCVIASLRATEVAVGKLRDALRPGMTENELWSILHKSVIEGNGDYLETRLLSAGQRTNPWFNESSSYVIKENELVGLDTDVVGCHGYFSDFSRTFHAGPDPPTDGQKQLYKLAYEHVSFNIGIIRPGMSFREYTERAWRIPQEYYANRYPISAHGCGLTGEYPYLYDRGDFEEFGYDGIIEPGMVLCVESYIGKEGGNQGVKLEQQVLITDQGVELLSQFPFEKNLLE